MLMYVMYRVLTDNNGRVLLATSFWQQRLRLAARVDRIMDEAANVSQQQRTKRIVGVKIKIKGHQARTMTMTSNDRQQKGQRLT